MIEYPTSVLHRPQSNELRYLPEGPYSCGSGKFSWVAIQHGTNVESGSLNVFDMASGTNRNFALEGRPGFAFPTTHDDEFVVGLERKVCLFNIVTGESVSLTETVDDGVTGTIINDGVVFQDGLVFGCKDLEFKTPKAGLYFWRSRDRQLFQLSNDQTCSNGKFVVRDDGSYRLFDIDTPTQQVAAYPLDVDRGELGPRGVVIDLTEREDFPDGMIATPDGRSVIIAFYNPHDVEAGQAVQFSLATGEPEAIWRTPRSPRVTCPQLVEHNGKVKLILITAVENMDPEQQSRQTEAGCLFVGDTEFDSIGDQRVVPL